jgi:hypothetical protein
MALHTQQTTVHAEYIYTSNERNTYLDIYKKMKIMMALHMQQTTVHAEYIK